MKRTRLDERVEFMAYLQRLTVRPSLDDLTSKEARFVQANFDAFAGEVLVYKQPILWTDLDEIEVVKAPFVSGLSGWLTKRFIAGDDRYHVGLYFGPLEAVLPNVSFNVARYIVQTVAFYAPQPVRYSGPDNLSPLASS